MIPEELSSKIADLSMTPADWTTLSKAIDPYAYRIAVCEYQAREREKLPRCKSLFGVCRYNDHGRCGYKDACNSKIR